MKTLNFNDYEEIINKIKDKIKYYEIALENSKYFFLLANGDMINLSFPKSHIPHLLGIYTDKLKTAGIVKNNEASYDILKKLVNSDLTYTGMKNTNSNFDINSLFSEFADSKIEIFTDILKVRTDDLYCVIKYCSERSYATGEEKENSDYFIIRKHNRKFSVLGIVKNGDSNYYIPVTSRLFDNYDELCKFLDKTAKNQEITYPVSFRIDNYDKEYTKNCYSSLEEKLEYNRTLKDISYKYNAIPSTNRDFLVMIEKLLNNKQKNSNNSSILMLIKEGVVSGNIIDKGEIKQILDGTEIPNELEHLIDACNDSMCNSHSMETSVHNSYSTIQRENDSLKEKLEELKNKLLKLQEKNFQLEEENSKLNEINSSNSQKLKTLTDAFESIKHI